MEPSYPILINSFSLLKVSKRDFVCSNSVSSVSLLMLNSSRRMPILSNYTLVPGFYISKFEHSVQKLSDKWVTVNIYEYLVDFSLSYMNLYKKTAF